MASTLLTKPFPSSPLLTSRFHFSERNFAVRRRRSVHLSRSSCTGSPRLSRSFGKLSVSASSRVPNGGFGHELDVDMCANSTMDGYAPTYALPDRYGGPVEGHLYGGEDRETGSSRFSSLMDSVNQMPVPSRAAGIQGGNSSPGTNPSNGYRTADVYASESSPVEEFNPVQSSSPAQNSTSHPSPVINIPVSRTEGTNRAPSPTNRPVEGGFNRSQAPPSRAYSTSSGPVEGSYSPRQEPRPIENAGSPSNPSYSQQQPGNIYRPLQGGGASPNPTHQQQPPPPPEYSANTNRPGVDSVSRNVATGVPPSRQSGSMQGENYSNTDGNARPVNFNTAQEDSKARAPSSYGAGTNDVPGNASKSPADREPSAAAAAIDKYLGPSTLKLEKRDNNSPPPPPPPRKYPNTTEKKSGKDLVAESAACAVIEKYLGPWPGFPPRDPKIDEYLDSLPENAACAAIDKYFGPYKPLFVFKKNEGENADNGRAASRPPRNRSMGRSGPRSRVNPPQGASTSRPWTPPSQGSSNSQNRSPPGQGANESRMWTPPQGAGDRRPTRPGNEDVKPQ